MEGKYIGLVPGKEGGRGGEGRDGTLVTLEVGSRGFLFLTNFNLQSEVPTRYG